ncbi:hypothetical protein SARC_00474 [Sphaeroforma arctica JP610]|uniref:Uncharacterized protein n=1 Tax=Sphaeroforma arctica JP610 TaxID=667725 RepID=A0A0L0GEI2_9EUKA|nr:hypothetical protein SARC_00474 [Sphaeroforma arctica JP610]KNC87437.1 hypothetical protein SARC_00474 [Sphaeroforma arctica JP610]|eukprot:XP_014161339.1 hypothetical protein SARC_00474 [Sphaeroforma arctica JP610]
MTDDSVDPSNNRCRKPGDDGEACTVQATVCGDGVKTDNEECETNPDGSGDIRTRNDDDYSIGPNDSDDDNYCDANCELQPIRNCRAISTSRCVCSSGTFTRTYTRTREKTPRGADCDDSNGNAITFDSDDMATITDDGICVCECGNGVVDTGNGEECDEGQDAVLSSTEVCRHCEIVEQECGDGTVDTIRNEQCDPPFSEGGQISSVNGNVQYCRDNCRTAAAGECEFTIAQGKCQCTIDSPIQGTRQVRTVIDQQEEPQGYMGGCPEEETVTEDCECESCVGQWQDYNFADGRPRCQFDGTDCLQKERFVRVSGDGSICENQDTSGEFFRINSHRDIAGPNGCTANGACVACEENYKKKQCNVLCGTGSEVGFYTITTQPGYASTAGRQGSELQCECREEGDACTSDTWVELPDSECGVDGSNSNNPCTCEGNEQKARFVRECTYEVDFPTALGLPFVDLDIAKFYRPPNQNTFEDGFPVDQSSLQYNLKAIETTAKFDLEGRIRVVNEEVSGVRYTATFRDPEITVAVKSGGAQLVASKYGDQSEYSVIQAGATKNFIFDYPTQTHTSSVTQGLNQITTNSESDERLRFTVDGDAIGTVTGGGNQINEISGSYGVKLVAKFEYEGCDLGDAYEASQYSECDADTKSS